jgi:3-oxoacyl-[acyl-carrier protein] reductase
LQAWARSLAQDAGPRGQRVNVLAPGYVDTDLLSADTPEKRSTREAEVPLRRLGSPEDMAGAVSFLIGEDSAYMTGAVLHVNGGLYLP